MAEWQTCTQCGNQFSGGEDALSMQTTVDGKRVELEFCSIDCATNWLTKERQRREGI